jgi:hypothetical protein
MLSMQHRFRLHTARHELVLACVALVGVLFLTSCEDGESTAPTTQPDPTQTLTDPQPGPGETCEPPEAQYVHFYFSPPEVIVAPGQTRHVTLRVEPEVCHRTPLRFSVEQEGVIDVPKAVDLTYGGMEVSFDIVGKSSGTVKLNVGMSASDGELNAVLPVLVQEPTIPTCSGKVSGKVNPGQVVGGTGDVSGSSIGLQANADMPAQATEQGFTYKTPVMWPVSAFDATIECADDGIPAGYKALGPAIKFGPETTSFPREIPLVIPIQPAALPAKARMRHVRVAYHSPAFPKPRVVPVADVALVANSASPSGYVLSFAAPRLGTYQAVVKDGAGEKTFRRRLTHRAIVGVSMGGGGSAQLGFRHHDKFDVIAPLGGPVDWTWMLTHIEKNHIAGFFPNDGTTVPTGFPELPKTTDPYEHASSFNAWWYEYPRNGNGGSFSRREYLQIFRDLSLMYGNPNSENSIPGAQNLPRGVDPTNPAVSGTHPSDECVVWVDPISGHPDEAKQKELDAQCAAERCKSPMVFPTGYYDDEFNPKGTWPVITVCDGSPQDKQSSPYANQWSENGNNYPLEVGLAVDYNGNGKRDANEPILRQGHEPFQDVGTDGLASKDEPGYQPGVNEDPAGDDYNAQYNPTGTEGNGRHEDGEPFSDFGLDGVPNTASSPYDIGEGDGKYTEAAGLRRFWTNDSHSILHNWQDPPGGPMTDEALSRIDLWTDGGTRDLFNFAVAGQHLTGAFAARGRGVNYYTDFSKLPLGTGNGFLPQTIRWEDVPGGVLLRYGPIDPTSQQLINGDGQHVGTVNDIASRLQSALYFISSRWPDAPRGLFSGSREDPVEGAKDCEVQGSCTFAFKDSRGREGPVTVNLPPGYSHKLLQHVRYPVIFMLHGYGQTPEDLGAAIIFLANWMNSSLDSTANRLSKAIMVYADGRCRIDPSGKAECIRGSFFADSPRENGGKLESWFLELMGEIDKRYRTMPEETVDWPAD